MNFKLCIFLILLLIDLFIAILMSAIFYKQRKEFYAQENAQAKQKDDTKKNK